MRQWAADGIKAQMCVTSPPYFGLRDYGHEGQIGLEQTPEEYITAMVEVFRCVRDVLADDGTLWLNIGDSYASGGRKTRDPGQSKLHPAFTGETNATTSFRPDDGEGVKPKDLIGIPWMLARALRDPYYTGPVKDVCDQVWLAAMLDAEGSICGTEYQTGDRIKTNIYISITNTSVPVIEKCDRLFPQEAKHIYEKVNANSSRKCFRWDVERMDQKAMFLRTIYPHLVAKRKQAIIGYTFIEMQRGLVSKKKGYLPDQQEQRSWLMQALSLLNSGQDVDIPDWCIEPPSLFEPGYYLRQDIIWHKPNPMPESVRDRCTKAHEYIFLLSKSERYFFDSEAMREDSVDPIGSANRYKAPFFVGEKHEAGGYSANGAKHTGGMKEFDGKRNRRSVWTVATRPYKGAHFATFPTALIEPCILAGSRPGDIVLDPFMGSGTTAAVSLQHGRQYLGCELNPEFGPLQQQRIDAERTLFT
jgi:DNA modification methylase